MRILKLAITALIGLSAVSGFSQISISPEIGLSYLPFDLKGQNASVSSNKIDYVIGLSAQIPLAEQWSVKTRLSFSDRNDARWMESCICPGYQYTEYSQADINVDFILNYHLRHFVFIGAGPSIIRKIDSYLWENNLLAEIPRISQNKFEYGFTVGVMFNLINWNFSIETMRKLFNQSIDFFPLKGDYRFNIIIGYNLIWKKR